LIVRVKARAIFPNCPRNVHKMQLMKLSKYVPQPGSEPLEPKWKDQFKDVMHPRQPKSGSLRIGQLVKLGSSLGKDEYR